MSHSKMRPAARHVRPILGCCFAALLGLTTVIPGPATAQQQGFDPQLSQIIGGALIAGGLAKILSDRADDRADKRREEARRDAERRATPEVRVHRNFDPVIEPPRREYREEGRRHRRGGWRTLPAACLRDVTGPHRTERVVGQRCLQREGVEASLPVNCATTIRQRGREHIAYRAACLQDAGFRFR